MQTRSILANLAWYSLLGAHVLATAQTTSLTYQGRLAGDGALYTGNAEFAPTLWDAVSGGNQVAANNPLNVTVVVSNGLFTLPMNFGNTPFDTGSDRWLELSVRTNGAAFVPLSPRQPLTSAPYALAAGRLIGSLPSGQLSGTYENALNFTSTANNFTGNGAGLTELNASRLASGTVPDARLSANIARANQVWRLGGNAGTTPATQFLGTTDNQPLELKANGGRILRLEPNPVSPNVVGGSRINEVSTGVIGATIAGGGTLDYEGIALPNWIEGDYATISGGVGNVIQAGARFSAISGGYRNRIETNSHEAFVAGGGDNRIGARSDHAFIGGGELNSIGYGSIHASILGGRMNTIDGDVGFGTIGGGWANQIEGGSFYTTIAGGLSNQIKSNATVAAIGGGNANRIDMVAYGSYIGGGVGNAVLDHTFFSTILGGYNNYLGPNSRLNTIGGGDSNHTDGNTEHVTISGGGANWIRTNSHASVIGGGIFNSIREQSSRATISGGFSNRIALNASSASIGGGFGNAIGNDAEKGTIAGGHINILGDNAFFSSIGGGNSNSISSDGKFATISGGANNRIAGQSFQSSISGGGYNEIGLGADNSTIGGGLENRIVANADYSTIPGGRENLVQASYSLAAGRRAEANHIGSFVWADSQNLDFGTTGPNQFLIRAAGGVGINGPPTDSMLQVFGSIRINDNDLYIRSFSDKNHGLGWRDTFDNQPVDGPLLYGWAGGMLGTTQNGADVWALRWDHAGRIYANNLPGGDYQNVQWDPVTHQFFQDNSSRRYKKNIQPLEDDFDKILEVEPKTYTRPGVPDRIEIGVIAEDVDGLGLKHLVQYDAQGRPDGVKYDKLSIYLIEVTKRQRAEITSLSERLHRLENLLLAHEGELSESSLPNRLRCDTVVVESQSQTHRILTTPR